MRNGATPLVGRPRVALESTVLHMVGIALLFTAAGMFTSLGVDLVADGGEAVALGASACVTTLVGLLLWRGTRVPRRVPTASAFAAVAWTWLVVSAFGALPFYVSGLLPRIDDALFESVSGFSVTGSTVLSPIEGNSLGLLFWRQLTQWYGGMGMIVLAVAVLPFLGVGGLELIRAEAPGETSDRLVPRVSGTAKRLWLIYAALTALTAVALLLTGAMAPNGGGIARAAYDAVVHAMTAVATGGFSTYDASIGVFDSILVEIVLIAAMVLGAVNFTLHWRAATGEPSAYWRSAELRLYAAVLIGATLFVAFLNVADGEEAARSIRDGSFSVASMMTTTGFATADWGQWVAAAQLVILALMVTGGMVGSTSGAMKLFRIQIMVRHAWRELRRARHPRGVLPVKLGKVTVPESVVARVAGFVLLYILIAIVGVFVLAALGADVATAAGSVVTAMGNGGPGLEETGPAENFLALPRPARGVLMFLMLLGRLELFPMLLIFAAVTRSRPQRVRVALTDASRRVAARR